MKALVLTILSSITLVSLIIFIKSFDKELYHIILGASGFLIFLFLLIMVIMSNKDRLFS